MKSYSNLLVCCAIGSIIPGCGKDGKHLSQSTGPCVVASCPSYFNTTQTFTYDESNVMTQRTYDFGYSGYGPYTQTISSTKLFSSYDITGGVKQETDVFLGGTGNLYDGTPVYMTRAEHQTTTGSVDIDTGSDTLYSFHYDSKKRLDTVNYWPELNTSDIYETYSLQLFRVALAITYDDSDNAVYLRQIETFRSGVYDVNTPSNSYFTYQDQDLTKISVTYDDKPSPFSGSLKYWKFVLGDWGLANNTSWQSIITALSPNNPLTITYEMQSGVASTTKYTMTYNYNDKGYPADSYTYKCD